MEIYFVACRARLQATAQAIQILARQKYWTLPDTPHFGQWQERWEVLGWCHPASRSRAATGQELCAEIYPIFMQVNRSNFFRIHIHGFVQTSFLSNIWSHANSSWKIRVYMRIHSNSISSLGRDATQSTVFLRTCMCACVYTTWIYPCMYLQKYASTHTQRWTQTHMHTHTHTHTHIHAYRNLVGWLNLHIPMHHTCIPNQIKNTGSV